MTKAVEPYTDEELERLKRDIRRGEAPASISMLFATIEADREKLAEKDARIAELEEQKSFTQDVSAFLGDKWVEERDMRHGAYASTKDAIARAEAAEARVSELEKAALPFARYAEWELNHNLPRAIADDDGTPVHGPDPYSDGHNAEVDVGDFKRLVAALPTPPEEEAK